MGKNIKKIVNGYIRRYGTSDPFDIAKSLNIEVYQTPLGNLSGYYKYMKRHKCIFINSDIEDKNFKKLVMAHELGHAILDHRENCYFINSKTLLLSSKIEKRANTFAAFLLIDDEVLNEYIGFTKEQLCSCIGYPIELIELRLK